LIGDIHGYADDLTKLLKRLGYRKKDGCYRHPGRKVIFLGDFIDRGPRILETLEIARTMVDAGKALAVMGNHEYNAICYHTSDGAGWHLREHNPKNNHQHAATLEAFRGKDDLWLEYLTWFKSLPLFLELPGLRVVHACWDDSQIKVLNGQNRLTDELLFKSAMRETKEFHALDVLLKGKEILLPQGCFFDDKEGFTRPKIRVRWWMDGANRTYRDVVFPDSDTVPRLPIPSEVAVSLKEYSLNAPPVFMGHYWLPPAPPELVASNIACLDYSVAKGGFLTAYRWDGERTLNPAQFVTSRTP